MNFGKIEKQGYSNLSIPNAILAGKDGARFNGSIIEYKGQILFVYRCYSTEHGRSCIGLTRFNKPSFMKAVKESNPNLLEVELTKELHLYALNRSKAIMEDPRFTIHKGSLYVSYVELLLGRGWHPCIRLCKLDDNFNLEHNVPLTMGVNEKGVEKNWLFFSHIIYS